MRRRSSIIGKWIIIDDISEIIDECFYVNGELKRGDNNLCFYEYPE
ncbi:MAG: hypothetical protein ACMUIL_00050 [bacterium]